MKLILTVFALLSIASTASAGACKDALTPFVAKYQAVMDGATDKCVTAANKSYDSDFAKKMAVAAACPKQVKPLKAITVEKRKACEASCNGGAAPVCDTKIGLQAFYDRVAALD